MPASEYDDSDSDSGDDVGTADRKALKGIDKLYKKERKSRLGNVKSLLAVAAVGFVTSILVIVPDNKWEIWQSELKEEGNKKPYHNVHVHDNAFGFRVTQLTDLDEHQNVGVAKRSGIILIPYFFLVKEYLTVWKPEALKEKPKGLDEKTSVFFDKHWGVVLLQHREQVLDTAFVAKAAGQIQTIKGGRRYVIWDDAHWKQKTDRIGKSGESKGVKQHQQKRKRVTKIKNGVISKKKKKLNQQKVLAHDQANHEDNSGEEDHYLDDDEEPAPPKQEHAGEVIQSTEVEPNLDDASTKAPELASEEASITQPTESTPQLDDVLLDGSNQMTSHEFDKEFDSTGL